jgi:predicted AAA+ superfamily ATPase
LQQAASLPHAVIVSGLRRVGKSTLLAQMAHYLGEDRFYYLNFEDERFLSFETSDMDLLYQILVEVFGERTIFILDEIQNIQGWERFVRRFMDMGFKFYITGSNASLISRELGSRLTGRYLPVELFPFSFQEYLTFKDKPIPNLERLTTSEKGRLQGFLNDYLAAGGIPETLKYPQLPLHRVLYDDVLYRDIATRHQIVEVGALKELSFYLVSNPANLVSFNKLKERLKLGSVNTVKNYVDYLEASWLLFTINVYDYSVKRQQVAPKKVYVIDTGLAKSVGFSFSPNRGRLLENLVFLALRKSNQEIYYFTTQSGLKVDFYLPASRQLIQVSQEMNDPLTRERELRALFDALKTLDIEQGLILSESSHNPVHQDDKIIVIRSIAEWLLS